MLALVEDSCQHIHMKCVRSNCRMFCEEASQERKMEDVSTTVCSSQELCSSLTLPNLLIALIIHVDK